MERPDDINLSRAEIPEGQYLVEGKYLTETMRRHNIPFGKATRETVIPSGPKHHSSAGLIVFERDREAVDKALKRRAENKVHTLRYKGRYTLKKTDHGE